MFCEINVDSTYRRLRISNMENDILDSLDDLGYPGTLNADTFDEIVEEGPKNCEFTKIVAWLSKELQVLCKLESEVNAISSAADSSSFLLELSSFLKEMSCPYQCLLEGNVSQRLGAKKNKLILLDFLSTELEASRMINVNNPEKSLHVEMQESPTANSMKVMILALKLGKPPANITSSQLFNKLEIRIKEVMEKIHSSKLSSPLFTGKLSDKQWFVISGIQETMNKEYFLRREMLLKRLDVTVQSFRWSDRLKHKEKEITNSFAPLRQLLCTEPKVSLSDVLAAREDLSIIEKTSSDTVREKTQSSVNKVMIGRVPDRGGRPEEQQPPPPEMPSWQKRTDTPRDANTGRGDRGGRIQGGGWSNSSGNTRQGDASYGQGGNRNDPNQGGGYQSGGGRGGGYGGGYSQGGHLSFQGGYQVGFVQPDQGYQTGYVQTGQGIYQVAYQTGQYGYQQSGQGQGGYSHGGYSGGDSRNTKYNDDYRGDNRGRNQQYNGNVHSGRGGYSSRNEGHQYNNDSGGGGYDREKRDGWQNRGGGRGRGGRGNRGGRGGRSDGYSAQDQGYAQHNQYQRY